MCPIWVLQVANCDVPAMWLAGGKTPIQLLDDPSIQLNNHFVVYIYLYFLLLSIYYRLADDVLWPVSIKTHY